MRCKYAKLVAAIYASSPLIKSRQIADRSKLKGVIMEMEIPRALEHEYSANDSAMRIFIHANQSA